MRAKVSFGRTMMQALELLWLAKRHIFRRSDVEEWRNQVCSYSHYQVMCVWRHHSVSQSVGQSVSQSAENSVKSEIFKFHINFVEGFMIDLKAFLGLAMRSMPRCYKVNFGVIFWSRNPKPPWSLYIVPLYCGTVWWSILTVKLLNFPYAFEDMVLSQQV